MLNVFQQGHNNVKIRKTFVVQKVEARGGDKRWRQLSNQMI